ncbi:MAG: DUF4405 domain-containing protein [Bacteroidales bacterium]|nr:DUF4405 domain-containing protein [Bacteroidales bacterium]
MKIKRSFVTPYITFSFLVIAITGILMLFHVFDGFTEVLHEITGLMFVIFSILHIVVNWKSLKSHFKKRAFHVSFVLTVFISTGIVMAGKGHGEYKRFIIQKLSEANIVNTCEVLQINYHEAEKILRNNDLVIDNAITIEEIGRKNHLSPDDILEIIINNTGQPPAPIENGFEAVNEIRK